MEQEPIRNNQDPDRTDLQTASLFFILALLTGLFVLGFKWAVLTPTGSSSAPPVVESASK